MKPKSKDVDNFLLRLRDRFNSLFSVIKKLLSLFFCNKSKERDILFLSKFVHSGFCISLILLNLLFFLWIFCYQNQPDKIDRFNNFLFCILPIFLIFFITYNTSFIKTKNIKFSNIKVIFVIFLLSLSQMLPFLMYFIFSQISITYLIYNVNLISIFYIFSIVTFCLSSFFSHMAFSDYYKNKKYDKFIIFINSIFLFFYTVSIFWLSNYQLSLYAPRFIERPENSSWYLIHNGNTTSDTINGMTKDDIKHIKQSKSLFNTKNCESLLETNHEEKCKTDNQPKLNQRPNALYGYMAWNLGNTKVFCPISVDFFDGNDNKAKSSRCLVIESKYLQPISAVFLSH